MPKLVSRDYYRALFHVGMSGVHGIPAQDIGAVRKATMQIPSVNIRDRIINQLDACDIAYEKTDMTNEPANYKSLTTGDVNRSEVRFDVKESSRRWWDFYLTQCDKLCNMLWVPNYWREDVSRYRFERIGAEFVEIDHRWLVADTSLADKFLLPDILRGGSGF
jgi:hypothetical protein